MEHLLQSQIQEGCRLALPEGLQDLMSDISREVLRAQPPDLYQFIADYLSALLVARENLTVASKLCKNVCECSCYPELGDELRFIGLDETDADTATKIIMDYFEAGGANETTLMIKIQKKINIEEDQLPAIQDAVRKAFQRNLINNTTFYETSSDSEEDEVSRAAKHTLKLYRRTKHNPDEYAKTATNVKASYRAYGVKRSVCEQEASPAPDKAAEKVLRFSADVTSKSGETLLPMKPCYLTTVSSTSLAGSYMNLPRYVPYSVHDNEVLDNLEEIPEKENVTINYTDEEYCCVNAKKHNFLERPKEIEDQAIVANNESDESIHEMVYGESEYSENEVEEDFGEDQAGEDEVGEDEVGKDEFGDDEVSEDKVDDDIGGEDKLGDKTVGDDEVGDDKVGDVKVDDEIGDVENKVGDDKIVDDKVDVDEAGEDKVSDDKVGDDKVDDDNFGDYISGEHKIDDDKVEDAGSEEKGGDDEASEEEDENEKWKYFFTGQ